MDYKNCTLCPRKCGVNRSAGQLGYCGLNDQMIVSHVDLHYGEEPCISGGFGSGTVFFGGCSLGCGFCQNAEISLKKRGKITTTAELRQIFLDLIDQGADNINLVTASHFLPSILPALTPKLPVPVIYNCGGYESVETLKSLEGLVDVYLPDYKFSQKSLSKLVANAPDYPQIASQAIQEMVRQTGAVQLEDERIVKGTIIRHLILPGNIENSLDVIDWVVDTFPKGQVLFSLMAQYVPHGFLGKTPPFDRGITEDEYAAVSSWVDLCGITYGYFQERTAATDDYLPVFNRMK